MRADDMAPKIESRKLIELRAKTDRQLVALITKLLDSALELAGVEPLGSGLQRTYDEVSVLLPWVDNLPLAERRLLEWRLARLRYVLRDVSSDAALKIQTACS